MIIIDDSQEDQNRTITEMGDPRISYIFRGKKLGIGSARNDGSERANGNYLIFLDDDDEVTDSYLQDFATVLNKNRSLDIVYCAMKVFKNGLLKEVRLPSVLLSRNRQGVGIVLAGAWAVRKEFFVAAGGYDNRFTFGESMELFFRFSDMVAKVAFTDTPNFIRYASTDGASKNSANIIFSNKLMLEKHAGYFLTDKQLKVSYIQIIGVNLLRLQKFTEARHYLRNAFQLNPLKIMALLRFIISYIPFLSKLVYK
jgi:glycosyltransferase involved in cell wall biosynthesis